MAEPSFVIVLMGAAALPVFAIYLWFRITRFPVPLPWFLCCLLGGLASVFIALILGLFVEGVLPASGKVFFVVFRTALIEELSRVAVLFPLFAVFRRLKWNGGEYCAAGLVGGLGFALAETASYGAAGINITLLRAFTAAPLHGACGARIGLSAAAFRENPPSGIMRFFSAVVIHMLYNFMILRSGIPSVLAVLAVFSFLISSLIFIRKSREYPGE
ncbi:MAG: PrsW family intramembrane metalloprotease [Treponema sp.]|jgi:RsiW-degrading membrane proteinase PrsW (M82 family)|nr:PrsW family intramembrane metalloprotease [Treponema sp.]